MGNRRTWDLVAAFTTAAATSAVRIDQETFSGVPDFRHATEQDTVSLSRSVWTHPRNIPTGAIITQRPPQKPATIAA